ncbi:MAG: TolC family protein [Elusimicrobia bacterium]|nr:TolC family protein [Elusimicrobiota bacterium]
MRTNTILLAALFAGALPAGAAQLYTLDQCADYAEANSHEVLETALGAAGYRANADEARAARNPKFSLLTYAAPAYKVTGNALTYDNDYGVWGPYYHAKLEVQMPLYTWGKIDSYIGAAEHGEKVAYSEAAQKRDEVLYEVKKYYNGLLLARRLKRTVEDAMKTLNEAIEKADKLYQEGTGEVKKSDLENLKVYLAEAEKNQHLADKSETMARLALMQKMGMAESPDFDIADTQLKPDPGELAPAETYVQKAFANRPEWRMVHDGIQARQLLVDAERADRYPMIFLAGEAVYDNSPVRRDQKNPWLYDPYNGFTGGVAVGAKFDFAPRTLSAKTIALRAEVDKLKEKEKFAREGIELQVKNAWQNAKEAKDNIDSAKRGLDAAQRWVMAAGLVYVIGTGEAKDALEALAAKAKSEKDYYQAIYDYNMARADLAKSCGVKKVD